MIRSDGFKKEIREQWQVIRKLCRQSHRQWMALGVMINETPPEELYNLPLVLACSLLDETLGQMSDEGKFVLAGFTMLGSKMRASKDKIGWQNYSLVEHGVKARNRLAHEGELLSKENCFMFIRAIGSELIAWGLLDPSDVAQSGAEI
jgi:hypothetical protein